MAEDAASNSGDIVVTAQRRSERLQEVPISMTVLSGEALDRSTAKGVSEALSRVPGVSVNASNNVSGSFITVRGVTNSASIFAGTSVTAYYLDSAPLALVKTPISPDSSAYDLERVEVLRGPQGTLYGNSALIGVVRVLTKAPDMHDISAKGRASLSTTEGGDASYRGDAMLNIPIIEDKIAVRAVVGYQNAGGWIDAPNAGRRNVNDSRTFNGRVRLDANPTDNLTLGVSAWISRAKDGKIPTSDDFGNTPTRLAKEPISTDFDLYSGKIGYDFGPVSVTSATTYLRYKSTGLVDSTPKAVTPTPLTTIIDANSFSQEFNLNSTGSGPFKFSGGAIYRNAQDELFQSLPTTATLFNWTNKSESYAVFGQVSRRFADGKLELALGLRYFHDKVSVDEQRVLPARPLIERTSDFSATTPRAVLTWLPSSNLTVYTSYSQGFRSGFDQNPVVTAVSPGFTAVKPDRLNNYELGTKIQSADGLLTFDGAVYYIDWEDVQQSVRVPAPGAPLGVTAVVNALSASGLGVEGVATVKPVKGLQVGATFSWNGLKVDDPVVTATGALLYRKGDRLNQSPEYTAGGFLDYEFPLGISDLDGQFSASVNYVSHQSARTVNGTVTTVADGDNILTARSSFSLRAASGWAVTLFVDNLTNETGSTYPADPAPPIVLEYRLRPRTFGIQTELKF